MKILDKKDWSKITVIGFLLVICLVLTYYFHFILKIEVVFVHIFYIPITLASLWWSRRGIAVAIFLALMLLVSHILNPLETTIWVDAVRAIIFVFVGTVVAYLNQKLRLYNDTLEQQVEERTSEIRELQEKQRAILDSIADAIIVLDNKLNVIWANKIAIERYGVIFSKKCYDALKWLKEPCSNCIVRKTFTDGVIRSKEHEGTLKNGDQINFIATCSPVRDCDGAIISVVEVFHDITPRKRAEEETLAMNRNLSAMYSIATIATQSFELDENLNRILKKILDFLEIAVGAIHLIDEDADKAVLHVQQGLPDNFVEKYCSIPLDNPSIAAILESQEPITTQELPYGEETVKSAEFGIEKVLIIQLCSREKVVGFIALLIPAEREIGIKDILLLASIGNQAGIVVENVRLFEETIKAYEELKSLDKMKNDFLSNVSHELKTPLISIKGFSEVVQDELYGPLTDTQKKAMSTVLRNCDRLGRLIDSMLYLTVKKAGRDTYTFVPVNISTVIVNALIDISPQVNSKELIIEQDIAPDLLLINGDPDKLTQVLINLVENATKFTPNRGKITVKAYNEDENVHITVSDTGIGIPNEVISNLFDKFYQVDASTTRRYGGTGIGLYISKLIVEVHNGKIWAESDEEVGTTFHVVLPK